MPKIVDFQLAADRRDVIHDAVRTLAEGGLVGLPTETSYTLAAHAGHSSAAGRLAGCVRAAGVRGCVLAVKGAAEALDYLADPSPMTRKLLRRFWPGPVTFRFPADTTNGLLRATPQASRDAVLEGGTFSVRSPGGDAASAILRLLPAPLIIADEVAGTADRLPPATADALATEFSSHVDLVVDAGECRYAQPASVVRVERDGWQLDFEGVASRRTLARLAGQLYLFVCTGNTCRSPMAEGMFRKLLASRLGCAEDELIDRGYLVASAGVAAGQALPASPEAVDVLARRAVDIRSHESQPITAQLVAQADQIFTMTRGHREVLIREFPEAVSRVNLLARDGSDISDPIGTGIEEYENCANEIEEHLREIVNEIPRP